MQRFTKTTSRTVAWLKRVSDSEHLVLAPPYQRNPVWSVKQQSSLIETILLEYPIPEIYMQDSTDESGLENHVVVDGQQRVRAVLGYIEGDYELSDDINRWSGLAFDDLDAQSKKKIFEYDFVVRILPELADEQIRSIFQRINRTNVGLNPQELRHATYWGPFIKMVEKLADLPYWDVSGVFSANDRRRMLDAEFVAEIAVAYLNGLQNKKSKLEQYFRIYETEFDDEQRTVGVFLKVLGEIDAVLPDITKTRWKKRSDFYTLFLCLATFENAIPLSKEGRSKLREILTAFGNEVSDFGSGTKTLESLHSDFPTEVAKYTTNVERAASDLASRRGRRDALMMVIGHIFETEV